MWMAEYREYCEMNTLMAKAFFKKTTLFATAFVLAVSTLTAAVPFILSEEAGAVGGEVHTTNLSTWDLSETRTAGSNQLVENGLNVKTVPSTGSYANEFSKAAGYYKTPNLALADVDSTAINFSTFSGVRPSVQIGVDRDGNGSWDGYLVYEPWSYGDGQYWTNKTGFGVAGSLGYQSIGTLAQYQQANPNAKVTSIGYSLGSGVVGDATITSIVIGETTYTFSLPVRNDVYVDDDYTATNTDAHTWGFDAFSNVQQGLDAVVANGTVHIADGSYYGTANVTKTGTKLIGTTDSRDTVKIYPTALSGQAGIFVNGVNNVTIKNLGVYGDNFAVAGSGALIKLNDGSNARIENVVVKNSSATGININSYSDVVVSGVYVAGAAKDGLSVIAQQNTVANSSHDIFIANSSFENAAWSAIAFGTSAKNSFDGSMTNKSIANVTLANVSTQYGQRGLYVDGAGGTVTSPSSNKLVLQNFYAGDNSNEYINNEQTADIDARGIRINIGNGVVVPASQMTQAQYDATLLKIKDKNHKNPTNQNYGTVQLVNLTMPVLTLKTASGTNLTSGGVTNQRNVVSSWTKPVGTVKFTYKYWNNIAGSPYKQATPAMATDLTETSREGSFTEGTGTHYIQIVAIDAQGNEVASNTFEIYYDGINPTSTNNLGSLVRGTVQITQTISDNLAPASGKLRIWKTVNGVQDNTKFYASADVAVDANGNVVYPLNTVTNLYGDGTYLAKFTSTDTAGNASVSDKTFVVDNTAPNAVFTYSNNNGNSVTNQNVMVTLTSNEAIQTPEGWTKVSSSVFNKFYESNFKGSVTITDIAGNSASKNFEVKRIDKTIPVISGVVNNGVYRGTVSTIKVTDQNFSQLFINELLVPTQGTGGWDYAPVTSISGDGVYNLRATDKAGNETLLTFTINNSVAVTIDEDDIDTTSANPTITGQVKYVADNAPVANREIVVTVDDVDYDTETNANGEFTFNAANLTNGEHTVSFGDVVVARFTTTLPAVEDEDEGETTAPAGGTPTTPIPLAVSEPETSPTVPTIVNPSTFAAVLGNTTDNSATTENGAGVEGASTENKDTLGSANTEANKGTFLGLNWYWWILIIAALAAIAWWIAAAVRKRNEEA